MISMQTYRADHHDHGAHCEHIVHLPVAPQITAMTRFSPVVPGRPGFMMPAEALAYLEQTYRQRQGKVDMVAISGPGDPLAVPDTTLQTIGMVRERYPGMKFGIRTLGIGSEKFAEALAAAGVDYLEMTVNGITRETLEKLYAWIRPGLKTMKIAEAVDLLITEQKNGVSALSYQGVPVVIVTTLYPGINLDQPGRVSRRMMELGAAGIVVVPYMAEPGSEVVDDPPGEVEIDRARRSAARYLPLVAEQLGGASRGSLSPSPGTDPSGARPTLEKPNVAVASSNGVDIDLHLGQTDRLLIYGPREDGLACLLGSRTAPPAGSGSGRWHQLAGLLDDCFAVLVAQAGDTPRRVLAEHRIATLISSDGVEGVVDVLFGGGKRKGKRR